MRLGSGSAVEKRYSYLVDYLVFLIIMRPRHKGSRAIPMGRVNGLRIFSTSGLD
ncbi:MAG: hypothetical protein GTO17_13140 [Candidatus Aminicenantes bacterium]|nr:hypothetical protein [Candidatus Aminicenantes bacterium]